MAIKSDNTCLKSLAFVGGRIPEQATKVGVWLLIRPFNGQIYWMRGYVEELNTGSMGYEGFLGKPRAPKTQRKDAYCVDEFNGKYIIKKIFENNV